MGRGAVTDHRVSLRIFDALVANGITQLQAAQIGRAALVELIKDARMKELLVVRVLDTWGQPHAVVARKPLPGSPTLFRFDILAMRRAERQAIARQLAKEAA